MEGGELQGNGALHAASLKLEMEDLHKISFLTNESEYNSAHMLVGEIQVAVTFRPQNLQKVGVKCSTRISNCLHPS